jgi:uncharacterized surface protein with fasciclin (FAS1) repeats
VVAGLMLLAGCRAPVATAEAPGASPGPPPAPNPGSFVAPNQGQPPGGPPPAPNPMIGGVPMYPSRDIVENLAQSPEHHTLVAALNVTGLTAALKQPGPFTVFAPTDTAFRALPAGLLDQLMRPGSEARLTALLNYHVVAGRFDSATVGHQLAEGAGAVELTTLNGAKLTARLNGAVNLLLRDAAGNFADIAIYDVANANGIVHVIDKVLMPAQTP